MIGTLGRVSRPGVRMMRATSLPRQLPFQHHDIGIGGPDRLEDRKRLVDLVDLLDAYVDQQIADELTQVLIVFDDQHAEGAGDRFDLPRLARSHQ